MAEEDAEMAFLKQMQAGQESMAWGESADDPGEGVISSNTENSDQQVKDEKFADDQDLRALSPSVSDVSPDGDSYDPPSPPPLASPNLIPGRLDSRPSSGASARKPRTIGGFLADDSDEDDSLPPTSAPSATSLTSKPLLQPLSGDAPVHPLSTSQLLVSSTTHERPEDDQNSSITVPVATDSSSTNAHGDHSTPKNSPVQKSAAISSSVTAAAVPTVAKARLPHDRAGILEDRIKEDPRGDLDAWLSLITEHRKRNKLDDARAVYERFFKVFPSAVSFLLCPYPVNYVISPLARINFGNITIGRLAAMMALGEAPSAGRGKSTDFILIPINGFLCPASTSLNRK